MLLQKKQFNTFCYILFLMGLIFFKKEERQYMDFLHKKVTDVPLSQNF